MTPPKVLKVGPHVYTVAPDALLDDDLGATRKATTTIGWHPHQSDSQLRVTVLHEALHAVWDYAGVDLGSDVEERVITAMAGPLLDTLRRNPRLVTWLTG